MVFQKSTSLFCVNGHSQDRNKYGQCKACVRDRQKRFNANLDPCEKKKRKRAAHQRYNAKHGSRVAELKKSSNLRVKYGITIDEYRRMFVAQDSRCIICGTDKTGSNRDWHTDHCHKTGMVRGILCPQCNVMIAMSRENPEILRSAIDYLCRASEGIVMIRAG